MLGEAGVEDVGPVDEHQDQVGAGADELGQEEAADNLLVEAHVMIFTLLRPGTSFGAPC